MHKLLMVSVALAPVPVKVTLAHAAFAVTVTVYPFSINTLSPATGTEAPDAPPDVPDQVEALFQLPDATEYLSAAKSVNAENEKTIARRYFLQLRQGFII